MEDNPNSHRIFPIVFNNKIIQIDYNKLFLEYKEQTVKSLIELVLEKSGQSKINKNINAYDLFCPCGNKLDFSKFLDENLCEHEFLENNMKNGFKGKYLLIEKTDQGIIDKIIENDKELSKDEINKIFNEKKEIIIIPKKNLKKKNTNVDTNNNVYNELNENSKKPFIITNEFKKRLSEFFKKEERARKILLNDFSLFYDENHLLTLLSIGINENKAKASLRMARNQINEAVLIATDKEFNWERKEYLYYSNEELLDKNNLDENLKKEIKKEYPFLNDEQIMNRILDIFEVLGKYRNMNEGNERNDVAFINFASDDEEEINVGL